MLLAVLTFMSPNSECRDLYVTTAITSVKLKCSHPKLICRQINRAKHFGES